MAIVYTKQRIAECVSLTGQAFVEDNCCTICCVIRGIVRALFTKLSRDLLLDENSCSTPGVVVLYPMFSLHCWFFTQDQMSVEISKIVLLQATLLKSWTSPMRAPLNMDTPTRALVTKRWSLRVCCCWMQIPFGLQIPFGWQLSHCSSETELCLKLVLVSVF